MNDPSDRRHQSGQRRTFSNRTDRLLSFTIVYYRFTSLNTCCTYRAQSARSTAVREINGHRIIGFVRTLGHSAKLAHRVGGTGYNSAVHSLSGDVITERVLSAWIERAERKKGCTMCNVRGVESNWHLYRETRGSKLFIKPPHDLHFSLQAALWGQLSRKWWRLTGQT